MDFFNNVSINTRLWLIMCFMALMMLIGGGVGLVGIVMTDRASEAMATNLLTSRDRVLSGSIARDV